MKRIVILLVIAFALISCEKEVKIDLNSSDPKIVIDGSITDGPGPYFVKISKTVNFSDASYYPSMKGALVIISDNTGIVDTLSQRSDGLYQTRKIIGKPGGKYSLQVALEGKNFTAFSTMPIRVKLDSLRFNAIINQGRMNFMVIPKFADPLVRGNYYRFIQIVNGMTDKSYFVQNDIATNGTDNELPIFSQDVDIKEGDAVTIEMRCLDLEAYTYYYTLSQITGGFIGGATPSNPPNNIKGDYALGLFAAYTSQTLTQLAR